MKSNNQSEVILNKWVDAIKKEKVSEQQETEIHSRLMTKLAQQEARQEAKSATEAHEQKNQPWKLIKWLRGLTLGPQLGFAASFGLACVIVISLVVSTSVTSPAFASVKAKLAKVTSMYYTGVMKSNGVATMELEIFQKAPNNLRIVTRPLSSKQHPMLEVVNIFDIAKGQGLTLMPHANIAMPLNFEPGSSVTNEKENPLAFVNKVLNYPGKVTELPATWINERFANGYQITEQNMLITLWIDNETQLPAQVSVIMAEVDGAVPFEFEVNLSFNTHLEDALFDLTPPTGYRIAESDEH